MSRDNQRQTLAWIVGAIAGFALVTSLFFIRADFDVYAEGELQPDQQQHVFSGRWMAKVGVDHRAAWAQR